MLRLEGLLVKHAGPDAGEIEALITKHPASAPTDIASAVVTAIPGPVGTAVNAAFAPAPLPSIPTAAEIAAAVASRPAAKAVGDQSKAADDDCKAATGQRKTACTPPTTEAGAAH
jgi:hypothetical protein